MRKNIGNVICVLLISSLTLLGCSSENDTTNTEVPSEESNPTDISKDEDTPVNTNSDKGTKNTDSSDNTGNANGNSNKT